MSGVYRTFPVEEGDALYALLLDAHQGLDDAGSLALNARMVLLLAARIGDVGAVAQAVADARRSLDLPDAQNERGRPSTCSAT